MANLLLLTFSGLDQLAPAIGAALLFRRRISAQAIIAGILAGLAVVIVYTFWLVPPWAVSEGIIGLGVNVLVVAAWEGISAATGRRDAPRELAGQRQ